jgi:SAM-dependent methyltransferase
VLAKIHTLTLEAFKQAGIGPIRRHLGCRVLMSRMKTAAQRSESLRQIEMILRPRFQHHVNEAKKRAVEKQRAARAYERIKGHLVGEHLLDVGCGAGLIAQLIHERAGMKVTLADVLNYSLTDLPVVTLSEGGRIPLDDGSVDTTLIYLVLHHADDPLRLLDEAVRVTRSRIVVMEGCIDDGDTYLANCFFDWFLNRIAQGQDINLPLNFHTCAEWCQIFAERGLRVAKQDVVGIDEPLAPESHVLFVLDKATTA